MHEEQSGEEVYHYGGERDTAARRRRRNDYITKLPGGSWIRKTLSDDVKVPLRDDEEVMCQGYGGAVVCRKVSDNEYEYVLRARVLIDDAKMEAHINDKLLRSDYQDQEVKIEDPLDSFTVKGGKFVLGCSGGNGNAGDDVHMTARDVRSQASLTQMCTNLLLCLSGC